jgi:hypothetical protein
MLLEVITVKYEYFNINIKKKAALKENITNEEETDYIAYTPLYWIHHKQI